MFQSEKQLPLEKDVTNVLERKHLKRCVLLLCYLLAPCHVLSKGKVHISGTTENTQKTEKNIS